jgi:hypothetical protein
MAEAVKNKADAAEPGQQVTALKAIEMLTEGTDIFGDASDDQVVDRLLRVNKALEARWQQALDDASHGDDLEG